MKKQWRTIIISGGVLAALLVTWLVSILLPGGDPAETSATTAAIPAVFETAAENVTRIDVSNKSGQYALLPVETQDSEGKAAIAWRVEGKESYPFSSTALTDLANAAIKVAATAEVVANSADLASYGLDKPLATMTVTLKTGEKHVIKYGNELVSGSAAYVMLDDSGRICSVDSDISDKTGNSFLDLLDKTQVVGIEKNDLTNLTFERAKDGLMLVAACTLVGESDSETASLEFSLSEPLNIEGDSTALTTLAEEATGVSASKFIELDPKDLSKYGLDNPQYSFVLKSKDKTVLFKIGKMADGENYYATSDAMPAVFTIASNSFTTVDKKTIDMVNRFVCLQSIWKWIKSTPICLAQNSMPKSRWPKTRKPQKTRSFSNWMDRMPKIFNESNSSLFSTFYQRLISPQIAGLEIDAKPVNTHDAALSFSIKEDTENNVKAHTKMIEFARRDDYTYYVFADGEYTGYYVNGDQTFTTDEDSSEGLIVAYKMMKYAIEHASNGVFNTKEGYQLN